ncbi:MAG TPA: 5-oxoprolinase subunit PxpB [Caulobacteraceae bacterium]|jgi:KipI family sensor histidine kinase inhibitor
MEADRPRISPLGARALLFDIAGRDFDEAVQRRIWAACRDAARLPGVKEALPGMNNMMVVFGGETRSEALSELLREVWANAEPLDGAGRMFEAPTIYGGADGSDLGELAERTGMTAVEVAHLHAAGDYSVAAVGAMPGFVYLSGLDPRLAWPRRSSPRPNVPAGSVIIGGAQAGVLPVTAPTGWRSIGRTDLRLFDTGAEEPALLRPGDRLKFTVVDVLA